MPRGYRKKGQFALKIWYPSGASMSMDSTRDLSASEWVESMRKYLDILTNAVENVAKGVDA